MACNEHFLELNLLTSIFPLMFKGLVAWNLWRGKETAQTLGRRKIPP